MTRLKLKKICLLVLLVGTSILLIENKMHVLKARIGAFKFNRNNYLYHDIAKVSINLQHMTINNTTSTVTYNTSDCVVRNPKLSTKRLPRTALVSFHSSGNTWTRHLVQQMTGLATASVYCDSGLRKKGYPYECHKQFEQTILVKTHDPKLENFEKAVLLIRNPIETFYSAFNLDLGGHTGYAKDSQLFQTGWFPRHVESSSKIWVTLYSTWLTQFKGPIYLLQYENLQKDLPNELRGLSKFLDVDVTMKDIFCTAHLQEGQYHRPSKHNVTEKTSLMKKLYSNIMLEHLRSNVTYLENLIEKRLKTKFNILSDFLEM